MNILIRSRHWMGFFAAHPRPAALSSNTGGWPSLSTDFVPDKPHFSLQAPSPMRLLCLLAAATVSADDFPQPTNTETEGGSPMPAAEVAAKTPMPEGFKVTVFAAEPTVMNPIDCSWDSRGRMWVAENFTYERKGTTLRDDLRDRVILLKDTTGDGRADQRHVFSDDLVNLTSIEWTPRGLWVMCPPRLMFIPDEDRDAVPDGPPRVVLDGFTVPDASHHNFANGLRIGPDGWLYGRSGGSAPGEVGPPGATMETRIPIRGGIWRYHRTRGTFEVVASGTTNPWGHDWDADGNLFFINTVNDHVFHAVPGMRCARLLTIPLHPRVYETIPGIADHWHFDREGRWHESRDGRASDFGGGHAHVGMIIYQGTSWPAEYRGRLLTLNLHGRRINQEILEPKGSGFVARHGEDLFVTPDPFFRGVELTQGPHGEVHVLDWSDTGECHEHTGVHRTSGRIHMITHGEYRHWNDDLKGMSVGDLVSWCEPPGTAANQAGIWMKRMAAMELESRESVKDSSGFKGSPELAHRLGWGQGTRVPDPFDPEQGIIADIRRLSDHWPLDTLRSTRFDTSDATREAGLNLPSLIRLADRSPRIRLQLASTLQRLPFDLRKDLAVALVGHPGDADDPNLPLLVWYGLIPLADHHPDHLVEIFQACGWPKVRRFIARALAEQLETDPARLEALIGAPTLVGPNNPTSAASAQTDLVQGMHQALTGWTKAAAPSSWPAFTASLSTGDPALTATVRDLNVLFGDGRSIAEIERIALDPEASRTDREAAVEGLIRARPEDLKKTLFAVLDVPFVNTAAARGLLALDDPDVPRIILASLGKFHHTERDEVLSLVCSRPAAARVLLERIRDGKLPADRVRAFHARQIENLADPDLSRLLRQVWGNPTFTSEQKAELIRSEKQRLTPGVLAAADLGAGERLFATHCAACHRLHGRGGDIGPDLTGGGRTDLDYLLHNIIDPSAELAPDHRIEVITLTDGTVLSGSVRATTPKTLTLQTPTGRRTIEHDRIAARVPSDTSLMPEGLLSNLSEEQIRDLIAFLMKR